MNATKDPATGLVHVEFDWSDEHGECYDCGLPAAYRLDGTPGINDDALLRCSVCAALAVYLGDTEGLTHLFSDSPADV